jgi:hypothetical protein
MTTRSRSWLSLPALWIAGILVAGCAASAPTTSAGSPAAVTTPPAGSPATTAAPTATVSGGLPVPGLNADPALEAQLPGDVRGRSLTKVSVKGSSLPNVGSGQADAFNEMLRRLGTSAENLTVALALDLTGALGAQAFAFRLAGTDAARLINELRQAATASNQNVVIGQATLGGKSVTTITNPASTQGVLYAYAKGDTAFMVQAKDQALAEEILSRMP